MYHIYEHADLLKNLYFNYRIFFSYSFKLDENTEYNYDVEDFILRMIFPNLYNHGPAIQYCEPYINCTKTMNCISCPVTGYRDIAKKVNKTYIFRAFYII